MATVYEINKGINRSIEFKGVKAQYIIHLAVGIVLLLLLFAVLYVCGLKLYCCLAIVVLGGAGFIMAIRRLSQTYGEHGLEKRLAQKKVPGAIRTVSRQLFIQLKQESNAQK